jgi:DNA-binding MarR family transcriptional regulator
MKDNELRSHAFETTVLAGMVARLSVRGLERRLDDSDAGISALQFGVLRMLSNGKLTISELSALMLLAPATLVPVVDALERKGLARRAQDPNDRRRTPLLLTPAGAELVGRLPFVAEDDLLARGLVRMGDEKACQLLELLRDLLIQMTDGDQMAARVFASVSRQQELNGWEHRSHARQGGKRVEKGVVK